MVFYISNSDIRVTLDILKPNVHRGIEGGVIITPFRKYKDFHIYCRIRLFSQWYQEFTTQTNDFLNVMKGNKINIFE